MKVETILAARRERDEAKGVYTVSDVRRQREKAKGVYAEFYR